jgi:hypothetical protein
MARLFMAGAETGNAHAEGTTVATGTTTFDTTTKRSGTASFKHDSLAGAGAQLIYTYTGVIEQTYFLSCWLYIPSTTGYPTTTQIVVQFQGTGSVSLGNIQLSTTGTLILRRLTTAIGSPSGVLAQDTWHRIDLKQKMGVGTVDVFEGRLNGSVFATSGLISHSDVAVINVRWGWAASPGASKILYVDDVILNDDTGSVNNSYPGDDKVVLLRPTADSARDANWFAGLSATTNLWDAVDNIPPVGISAGSATATSQITNAASTTTEAYSATMQTYTAAGIASGDTVTAVQGVVEAANGAASADTIGISIVSNPAVTEVLGSIPSSASTYPSQWVRISPSIAENPSLTLGTAPVMRVRKNLAATRRHTVCFMGMYVSYTVGAAPSGTRLRFILGLLMLFVRRRVLWQA